MRKPNNTNRQTAVRIFSKSLLGVSRKVTSRRSVADQYKTLSDEFHVLGKAVTAADPVANSRLTDALATTLGTISESIPSLVGKLDSKNPNVLTSGTALASALEDLGGQLVELADSLKGGCDLDERQASDLNKLRIDFSDLAFDISQGAIGLYDALGQTALNSSIRFVYPRPLGKCCSGARHLAFVPGSESPVVDPVFGSFDERKIKAELEKLKEFVKRLLAILIVLGGMVQLAISLCSSGCWPPFTWSATLAASGAKAVAGGFQPWISISWDYCCQNSCFIFWTDEFVVNVSTTTHDIGRVWGPGRGAQAGGWAKTKGTAAVAQINGGFAIPLPGTRKVPPIFIPPAPSC